MCTHCWVKLTSRSCRRFMLKQGAGPCAAQLHQALGWLHRRPQIRHPAAVLRAVYTHLICAGAHGQCGQQRARSGCDPAAPGSVLDDDVEPRLQYIDPAAALRGGVDTVSLCRRPW